MLKNMTYENRKDNRFPHILTCPVLFYEGDYYSCHYLMDFKNYLLRGKMYLHPNVEEWITDNIGHRMMEWHCLFGNDRFEIRFATKEQAKLFWNKWSPYTLVRFHKKSYQEYRDLETWLKDNIKRNYKLRDYCIWFEHPDDATLFKLTWG